MPHFPVRRSEITTPGHSVKMITKAAGVKPDLVMMDLEDACAVSQKVAARDAVIEAANTVDWGDTLCAFRPNNVHTQFFFDDMLRVIPEAGANLDIAILPKTESADEIRYVDQLLTHLERKAGLPHGKIKLEVLIESCKAVLEVEKITAASPRLEGLIFGVADYAAETGADLRPDINTDFTYARQKLVNAAHANDLLAIDCVTINFRDMDQVRIDAETGRRMGFDGKWCIHPGHVEIVNEVYTPTAEQVVRAKELVALYEKADVQDGLGAVVYGDEMVDMATVRVEQRILETAKRAGKA
ncbi:MAG: HpcH/HpaI aldolase/citrate lyase family protein [Thermoplasmatota archaeon]